MQKDVCEGYIMSEDGVRPNFVLHTLRNRVSCKLIRLASRESLKQLYIMSILVQLMQKDDGPCSVKVTYKVM